MDFFRLLLLFADGVATICAIERMWRYRQMRSQLDWYQVYGFFAVLSLVYLLTTLSDLVVIARLQIWWAETPIVRGLILRVPIALALFWMSTRKQPTGERLE